MGRFIKPPAGTVNNDLHERIAELERVIELMDEAIAGLMEAETELEAENKRLREAAEEVVESKRGIGRFVPSSVGWAIDKIEAALAQEGEGCLNQ